jgi:hypothetical protein
VAEVALKHTSLSSSASHPADSSSASVAFGQTILLIVRGLDATCRAHANPRKVFTLQVGRLLRPVLRARLNLQAGIAQAQSIGQNSPNKASAVKSGLLGWTEQMLQALESLLEGGLFHGAHMAGYPEISSSLEDPGVPTVAAKNLAEGGEIGGERTSPKAENPKKKRKKKGEEGGGKTGEESAKTKLASYHRLLFQELEAGVNGHDPAVVGSLDWFLRAYSAASKREQRSSLTAKSRSSFFFFLVGAATGWFAPRDEDLLNRYQLLRKEVGLCGWSDVVMIVQWQVSVVRNRLVSGDEDTRSAARTRQEGRKRPKLFRLDHCQLVSYRLL